MPTTERFQTAIEKLYRAFHSSKLHPECSRQCAVGTLCDQNDFWSHFSDHHGDTQLNYVGRVHQLLGKRYHGYSPQELLEIEAAFLEGCGYQLPLHFSTKNYVNATDKHVHFKGLCAAIQKLSELDQSRDPLDISVLLDYLPKNKSVPTKCTLKV
ncbi:Na(+)-translocating NADH-quinone reductase subunit F [Altibacter sp. HG106]|uniref:Na(+)-translocating NADH-quinone reductase subunit F n=1 Tax=Altibacter sp. HG106 TaxID=3023937 RepID=UPI00235103BE|nr:Na(+)-translocating NADH-quinone reductase subunit F [Altibacter sp. HG106]MDC7994797.1 Na(+)-translocating NADH-quinone reductase subunit F [Altibacter sp. HG106]